MENKILEFVRLYNRKQTNDKEIAERKKPAEPITDYTERVSFTICSHSFAPGIDKGYTIGCCRGTKLFSLDNDDMEYLYKKYSVRMEKEKQLAIRAIEDEYNKMK